MATLISHLGHKNICKYRPQFHYPEEHDECIIQNWNSIIRKKNQIVWVLGDFLIHNNKRDIPLLLSRLNGTIKVIPGNHDCMDYYPKEMIQPGLVKKYGYWLTHCPIHPQELRGHKVIYAHVHNHIIPDKENYFCVCAEQINFTPISLEEIREKFPTRKD